jgi:DNA-binding transcriptional MerR regulator
MDRRFTISELAKEFQITTRTIRFYEEKGLLSPKRSGTVRLYDSKDRVRLVLILRGKRLGLTLDESRDIIDMYQPDSANAKQLKKLLTKIREKREFLKQQGKEINKMLSDLKIAEQNCEVALANAA